jgi:hypothetical protein
MTEPRLGPSDGDGWQPVLAFDNDHSEFVRGFECGRLWEMLKTDYQEFEQHIHATNAEMVLRMAEATERVVAAETLDETWMMLKVEAA